MSQLPPTPQPLPEIDPYPFFNRTLAMRNGKQVRIAKNDDAERVNDDDNKEDNFIANMTEIVASTRRKGKSDFQAKKNAIFKRARERNGEVSREILASVHDARAMLQEMMAVDTQACSTEDSSSILARRDNAVESLIEEFRTVPTELSPTRSTVINSASSTLQEQQDFYEQSRRKTILGARAHVEAGIERQRVITDASDLIRYYNALLRSTTSK